MYKIFISYKTGKHNNELANIIFNHLNSFDRFTPFLDKHSIKGGDNWKKEIYSQIDSSDVLVVLLTRGINESEWVKREVDYAKGHFIKILPFVINHDIFEIDSDTHKTYIEEINKFLDLDENQFITVPENEVRYERRYAELVESIDNLITKTRLNQQKWINLRQELWKKQDDAKPENHPEDPPNPKYVSYYYYPHLSPHKTLIHVASGNITQIKDIDIIVNSENNYMQMQRIFAPGVSKFIRLAGAGDASSTRQTKLRNKTRIKKDTIQDELNKKVFDEAKEIPVPVGAVFVTHTGGDDSFLKGNGIRYIFHVATLEAHPFDGERPISDPSIIYDCVMSCLNKVTEENEKNKDVNEPITSIIFPILGTGNGGLPHKISIDQMIKGVKRFLDENPATLLTDIYINGFTKGHVDILQTELNKYKSLDKRKFVRMS